MAMQSNLFVTFRILRLSVRKCSFIKQGNIRVRFAPSPTGYLHLGGLRTALYNYLFSKASCGKFILRIEDTDQSRLVNGAAEQLEEDLNWAGIVPDESPRQGGPYGPYIQSERLPLYKKHAELLVASGHAYRCFCTPRRLELLRQDAVRTRQIPRYDNRCRNLTSTDVDNRLTKGQPYCIRLKLGGEANWDDLILGRMKLEVSVEGDPILLKTDNFPTYHLACVVDDHLMKITHVLRGVEWHVSTFKHLQIYQAFQWQPPVFGHLPLLLNSDGSKLSKRQGGVTVTEQRNSGIYPRALITWLTLAGGGFNLTLDKSSGNLSHLVPMTTSELAPLFNLSQLHQTSCRLPLDLLPKINQLEIQRQLRSSESASGLVSELQDMLRKHYVGRMEENSLQLQKEYINEVIHWAQPRIHYLTDLLSSEFFFLWENPKRHVEFSENEIKILQFVSSTLQKIPEAQYEHVCLTAQLKKIAMTEGIPFSHLMKLLRRALSGLQQGPSVAEMLLLLGPHVAVARLESAISANPSQ